MKGEKIKKELEENKTINIKLDHRVTKLIAENEHLKQTYKQLYDSIKSSRIRSKEQCDDLIKQVHLKSTENYNLNASLQEQVLIITALNDNLRKLKGKAVVDEAVISHPIDPKMLKVDVAPLAPKLWNNRTVHSEYLKHTQTFTIVGNACPLTRITTTAKVPLRKPISLESNPPKNAVTLVYSRKPKESRNNVSVIQIVLWYLDSGCSKHMTGDRSQLINFVDKFLGTVKFGNDHVAKIMCYGDYQIGNITISRVYFVDGLGHKLFSVRKFCDSDLEVAFCQHTCFIRNLEGVDLLSETQGNNLYTLSLGDMMKSSPICRLSKASKTKSWLWHQRLSHLNFGAINHLARQGLVRDTNQEKLYLLHMDLCGPTRVESVNEKKYILVIIDDYSRFTWDKCLRSKDEAPDFIIKFLKMIQVRLKVPVRRIRTDNGTEFVNQTLRKYYEQVGISHETFVARSPHDVEEDNHDIEVSYMGNDSFFGMPILKVSSDQSSSTDSIHTIVHPDHQISEHNSKWTKDHPLENIIGQLARPVSTRLQLHDEALFCYYDALLTSVEPKTYKYALTQSCWIEAMQEELNEFERLKVWELVPRPYKVMVITLKWIYKVMLDELGGILKNKARLVARGYRQEDGIDF
uniref:Retrovirus-related Pol polyprotein from transposon TNT 1-94 n=1 Tax=Tanacetum cinerariifolium TaxID=118510 RepID=A0A6L2JY02_TANCI|nr:retrovirus-related Pol polyprotein from transposon TNT 1-94 [Tanacetum cinerariifolium]